MPPSDEAIHAKLDGLRDLIEFSDRQNQQRIELAKATITGRLDVQETQSKAVLERVTRLEQANQWVIRTIGGTLIGMGIAAVWAVKTATAK